MGNASDQREALVLTDGKGNWYAIPAEIVEKHKVTGERKAKIEQLIGDGVTGYTFAFEARPTEVSKSVEAARMQQQMAAAIQPLHALLALLPASLFAED
jgi:class 3 adenylate cyclase